MTEPKSDTPSDPSVSVKFTFVKPIDLVTVPVFHLGSVARVLENED